MPACSILARSSPTLAKAIIATFNVRGLTSNVKKQQLAKDILSYRVDVCGIQELKIAERLTGLSTTDTGLFALARMRVTTGELDSPCRNISTNS